MTDRVYKTIAIMGISKRSAEEVKKASTKPGGVYVVLDHVAAAGSGIGATATIQASRDFDSTATPAR